MRSPGHVEIIGGEFNDMRTRRSDVADPYYSGEQEHQSSMQDELQDSMIVDLGSLDGQENVEELESPSDSDNVVTAAEEPAPSSETSETAASAAADSPPATRKPLTPYERIRMSMAGLDINEMEQTQAVDTPSAPPLVSSSIGGSQSFGKFFPASTEA